MLVESKQVCVENRAQCIKQKQDLTQDNRLQSSFLSGGLGNHEELTSEVKEENQEAINPRGGMGR